MWFRAGGVKGKPVHKDNCSIVGDVKLIATANALGGGSAGSDVVLLPSCCPRTQCGDVVRRNKKIVTNKRSHGLKAVTLGECMMF